MALASVTKAVSDSSAVLLVQAGSRPMDVYISWDEPVLLGDSTVSSSASPNIGVSSNWLIAQGSGPIRIGPNDELYAVAPSGTSGSLNVYLMTVER